MKVKFFTKTGKSKGEYDLELPFLSNEANYSLIDQYIYVYLSNQRSATAKTKDRSEVSGGGKKPWKQKGTGRARSGSSRSPIWKGGGITFGPTGDQNYKKSMPAKMKRKAFESSIIHQVNTAVLHVSENPVVDSTSKAAEYVANLELQTKGLVLVHSSGSELYKYFKNLDEVKMIDLGELNSYDVVTAKNLVIFEDAISNLKKKY